MPGALDNAEDGGMSIVVGKNAASIKRKKTQLEKEVAGRTHHPRWEQYVMYRRICGLLANNVPLNHIRACSNDDIEDLDMLFADLDVVGEDLVTNQYSEAARRIIRDRLQSLLAACR